MNILKGIANYLRRQVFAIFWALVVLVGGVLCAALGAGIGLVLVALFAFFIMVSPLMGVSLSRWLEELNTSLEKLNAGIDAAKVKKSDNVAPFKRP